MNPLERALAALQAYERDRHSAQAAEALDALRGLRVGESVLGHRCPECLTVGLGIYGDATAHRAGCPRTGTFQRVLVVPIDDG